MHATRSNPRNFILAMAASLSLPLIAYTPAPVFAAPIHAEFAADPTVDEIFDAAITAVGGQEALDAIKSLRAVMSLNMQGMSFTMESLWSREGGRMSKTAFGGEEMIMASNGKVSWMKGPGGFILLPDAQKKDLNDQSTILMRMLDPKADMKERLETIENTGKTTFGGKDCWKLHYKEKDGEVGDVYYDVASGLPVGFESVEGEGEGAIKTQGIMSEWKEEKGVKFFRTITMTSTEQEGMTLEMKVDTVEINTLDAATFAPPEEVQKLASEKPAPGEPEKEIKFEELNAEQQQMATEALNGFKQSGDVNTMKQMVQRVEPVLDMMPPDQQLPIKYAIQELKKEIAKLGG